MTPEVLAFVMFGVTIVILILGFPVALSLAGSAILFAFIGDQLDLFRFAFLNLSPTRIFSTMKTSLWWRCRYLFIWGSCCNDLTLQGNCLKAWANCSAKCAAVLAIQW